MLTSNEDSKRLVPKGRFVYALAALMEGPQDRRSLLGAKGAGLVEVCRLGLPVSPAFTVTTDACR